MEIVGGFMVMMSIIGFFLAVIWLIMPFVVLAIKGKQDRTLEVVEAIERRLAALETRLQPVDSDRNQTGSDGSCNMSDKSSDALSIGKTEVPTDADTGKSSSEASPAG